MIYTVTFNPSIDYIVNVDNFMTGVVNRTSKEIIFPGGKGINVSMVLKNLGEESTALGFMAGFTGDAITRLLQEKGVTADFIHVTEGLSRINVKLRAQTETNQRTRDQDCIRRYPEALRKTGCIAGWRYTGTCRKHPGYNAGIHVYGYHGASAEQETQYCSRRDQRSADERTCLSSVFDQTKQS